MESLPFCSWYVGGLGDECNNLCLAETSDPNPIVDSEQFKMGKCAEKESLQRMKLYAGLEDDSNNTLLAGYSANTEIKGEKMALNLLMDNERIKEYDESLLRVNERTSMRRVCYKPVWPTAPRDFLCYTTWQELEDGSLLICTRSVPNKILEVEESYVPGNILISGYWIQPCHTLSKDDSYYNCNINSCSCKVTLIAHTDLGGTMPAWLMNLLTAEALLKILVKIKGVFDKSNAQAPLQ